MVKSVKWRSPNPDECDLVTSGQTSAKVGRSAPLHDPKPTPISARPSRTRLVKTCFLPASLWTQPTRPSVSMSDRGVSSGQRLIALGYHLEPWSLAAGAGRDGRRQVEGELPHRPLPRLP